MENVREKKKKKDRMTNTLTPYDLIAPDIETRLAV